MFKKGNDLDRLVNYLENLPGDSDIALTVQEINNWNFEKMTNQDLFVISKQVADLFKEIIKVARTKELVESDMLFVLQGVHICVESFIDFTFLNDRRAVHGAFEFIKNMVPSELIKNMVPSLKDIFDPESNTSTQELLDVYNGSESTKLIKAKLNKDVLERNDWLEMKLVNIIDIIRNNDDNKMIIQKIDHLNTMSLQEMPLR